MDEPAFWNLIQGAEDVAAGDMDEKCPAIKAGVTSQIIAT